MNIEKKKNFIINTIYIAILSLIIYIVILYGFGLLAPFLIAFFIAYLLRRPTQWLSNRFKLPYRMTSILLVILFYSTIGVLVVLGILRIGSSLASLFSMLPSFYSNDLGPLLVNFFAMIQAVFQELDVQVVYAINDVFNQSINALGDLFSNLSVQALSALSGYASSLPSLLIRILFTIISTFFIASDYELIISFAKRQLSDKTTNLILHIKDYVVGTLFVCVRSYALIMFLTFIELSIGLTLIRVENSVLVALVISVFDILPVLGTGGIMIPWMILVAFQGNFTLAIGLLVVYLAITVIRNILEPKIVGQQIGLHPIVTLLSMFVGTNLFGIIGLFGLPITISLIKHLNDNGTIKLFK